MKDPQTLARTLTETAADLVACTTKPETAVQSGLSPALQSLANMPDKTKATSGGRPLAVIQTRNGARGVFWKGDGKNNAGPTVGVRKIKLNGCLYRGGKYSGTFFVTLADLQTEGRNN